MEFPYRSLCVFCGSADGIDPVYLEAARDMGRLMAEMGIRLVYGAGRTGLMGALAEGALQAGGEVIGVVPKGLDSPQLIYTTGLTRLETVENIQLRKARMSDLADGFIALPGGYGTMDEFFEVLTWSQIGVQRKPAAILNTNGYYDALLQWVERAFKDKYIYEEHLALFEVDSTPQGVLEKIAAFKFPTNIERWLERE